MPRYRRVRREEITFLFAYDQTDPSLLHIFARHLTTIEDALQVWFDDRAEDVWNEAKQRFETRGETHVLYWTWLDESRPDTVLIISCFSRED
jgi:hypothetical protein